MKIPLPVDFDPQIGMGQPLPRLRCQSCTLTKFIKHNLCTSMSPKGFYYKLSLYYLLRNQKVCDTAIEKMGANV